MPVSYITYKDRKILHVDFKDIKDKERVLVTLEDMVTHYKAAKDEIFLLFDVRGCFTDPEVMDKLKNYGKNVFKGRSKKRAVLGVSGIKGLLLRGYSLFTNTEVATFDDIEEAKNYLAA